MIDKEAFEEWIIHEDSEIEEESIALEMCMATIDEFQEEELEKQGPHERVGQRNLQVNGLILKSGNLISFTWG
jgi:hypothetical protein